MIRVNKDVERVRERREDELDKSGEGKSECGVTGWKVEGGSG